MQNMHDVMPGRPGANQAPAGGLDRRAWLAGLGAAACGAGLWSLESTAAARPVRVAAASDLKFVLPGLLESFQRESGIAVEASFGSSGNFARQIRQGLPVDLFMSADEGWVDQLVEARMTRELPGGAGQPDRGVVYARGRIALYVSRHSGIDLQALMRGRQEAWQRVTKFAIANPELAPYGRAAKESLHKLGWWERVQQALVLGENIAQATQFVSTGAAQAGITALSLALAPEVAQQGAHILLEDNLHAPLHQRMVLIKAAAPQAQQLYEYLQSGSARQVFAQHGFQR